MLRTALLHPQILQALAAAGHGSSILIVDSNYPVATHTSAIAARVFLNVSPGVVSVSQVLEALLPLVPVEAIQVMQPDRGEEPPIFALFRHVFPNQPLQPLDRFAFYDKARRPEVALVVATGEQQLYANLLLTIGVIQPK